MYKWIPRDNFLFLLFNFRLKCEFNNQTASFICGNVIPDAEPQYIYFPASITNKNAHMTMFNSTGKRRWSILTKNKHWKERRTQAFFYAKSSKLHKFDVLCKHFFDDGCQVVHLEFFCPTCKLWSSVSFLRSSPFCLANELDWIGLHGTIFDEETELNSPFRKFGHFYQVWSSDENLLKCF